MHSAQELAKKLSKQRLAQILADTAAQNEALSQRLKLELMGDQTAAIATELKALIRSATRPSHFISYREASGFSDRLYNIATAIQERLLPLDSDLTVALCVYFLDTDARVYENVDDSGGDVGMAYRTVAETFVAAAPLAKDRARLVTATLKCIRGNGYGSHDPIHASCGRFLSEDEFSEILENLREDYRNAPKDAPLSSEESIYKHAAQSKGDPDLFKQVLLEIHNGEIKDYDRLRLAKLLSARERHTEALEWIEGLPATRAWKKDIETIQIAAYASMGRTEKIVALHKENFHTHPSPETYEAWLESLVDTDRSQARGKAIKRAADCLDYPETGIRLFLHLNEIDLAADFAIARIDALSGTGWYSLPEYAGTFEKANRPEVAILLYRKLLEDILEAARSKAYGHAARYWKKLDQLALRTDPPSPHETNTAYKARLSEKHKRKSSFWKRAELGE